MFGIANQLLAVVALAVATSTIVNSGRAKYAWVTITPMLFIATTTLTAGFYSIKDIFWPQQTFQGYLNSILTLVMMSSVIIILLDCAMRWRQKIAGRSIAVPVGD